jgi:hypothetical protein
MAKRKKIEAGARRYTGLFNQAARPFKVGDPQPNRQYRKICRKIFTQI